MKVKQKKDLNKRTDRIIDSESPFALSEAYRNLRTNLFYSLPGDIVTKKIIITSTMAKEGKTTTCVNLAVMIAQTNKKVLLIDCDLRKPRVNKFFKIKDDVGLSGYLSGQAQIEDIIKQTDYDNLFVISSGIIPPNPSELLGSERMSCIINNIEGKFDYVLIDTPPSCMISDSMILRPYSDGYLIVTRSDLTTKTMLNQTLEKLEYADAKILGVVLNGYDTRKSKSYKNYEYECSKK